MATDMLSMLQSMFGEDVVEKASAALGEAAPAFGKALHAGIPALLAGVVQKGSSSTGAADLLRSVSRVDVDSDIGSQIGGMLTDPSTLNKMLSVGESLLAAVFGDRKHNVVDAVAEATGSGAETALKALTIAAPAVFGMLKSKVAERGLDADGLRSLLAEQRSSVMAADIDGRVTQAMGAGDLREATEAPRRASAKIRETTTHLRAGTPRKRAGWWPWAAGIGVAALALALFSSWLNRADRETSAERNVALNQPADTARGAPLPVNVYFEPDRFEVGSAARQTIAGTAEFARANGRSLAVTGFAVDSGGGPDEAEAARRAALVRQALIEQGVPEDSIVVLPAEVERQGDPGSRRVEISLLQ